MFAEADKSKVKKRKRKNKYAWKEARSSCVSQNSVGPSIFATDIDLHLLCRSRSGNAT